MRHATSLTALFLGVAATTAAGTSLLMAKAAPGAGTSPTPGITQTTSAAPTTAKPSARTVQTSASARAIAQRGDRGDRVTRAQNWLGRLGLMTLAPTGFYGEKTEAAVRQFQSDQGLPVSGVLDQASWDALEAAAKDLPEPTPSQTPAGAPTSEPSSATQPTTQVANPHHLDERCLTGRVICIDKSKRRMYWVVDGQVQDDWSVRTGREGMRTREGVFSVYLKSENHWSTLYDVRMPYAMFFDGGQAVHYSSDFANNGFGVGSHGCVNMRDRAGAKWLFSQVKVGDKVVVHS